MQTLYANHAPVTHKPTGITGIVHKTIIGKHFKPIVQITLPDGNIKVCKIEDLEPAEPFTLKTIPNPNPQPARHIDPTIMHRIVLPPV